MARMLQALKNLEARSVRPVAGPAVQKSRFVPGAAVEERLVAEEPPAPLVRPVRRGDAAPVPRVAAVTEAATLDLSHLRGAAEATFTTPTLSWSPVGPMKPVEFTSALEPVQSATPPARDLETAPEKARVEPRQRSEVRTARGLERQVGAALSDPVRSQPLVDLGERMERDAAQTASKVVVLVGVGAESAAHETSLFAATVLAKRASGRVLLVDADLARRPLSAGLEYGQSAGLAEMLRGDAISAERFQPTAVDGLMFLPAGALRHIDISTAGARLEEVLQRLAGDFSFVLLDGGRTGDLAASALARQADAAYFVVQLGTVETSEAQAALRDFRAAGARVLGCVAT